MKRSSCSRSPENDIVQARGQQLALEHELAQLQPVQPLEQRHAVVHEVEHLATLLPRANAANFLREQRLVGPARTDFPSANSTAS